MRIPVRWLHSTGQLTDRRAGSALSALNALSTR
jgi:hypothetical protein